MNTRSPTSPCFRWVRMAVVHPIGQMLMFTDKPNLKAWWERGRRGPLWSRGCGCLEPFPGRKAVRRLYQGDGRPRRCHGWWSWSRRRSRAALPPTALITERLSEGDRSLRFSTSKRIVGHFDWLARRGDAKRNTPSEPADRVRTVCPRDFQGREYPSRRGFSSPIGGVDPRSISTVRWVSRSANLHLQSFVARHSEVVDAGNTGGRRLPFLG